jgi:hypothetical protein
MTDAPIDHIIAQTVNPTGNQIQALVDLGTAAARASEVVAASCPMQAPSRPLDRLDAVEGRLVAMIQEMQIVRAPLERFYDLLSDAQKALRPLSRRRMAVRPPSGERQRLRPSRRELCAIAS